MKTRMTLTESMALKKQQKEVLQFDQTTRPVSSTQNQISNQKSRPSASTNHLSRPISSLSPSKMTTPIPNDRSKKSLQTSMVNSNKSKLTRQGQVHRGTQFKSAFLTPESTPSITFSNLRVAPYHVVRLLDVKMTQNINEHGTLYFKALLSEEQQDQYVESNTEGTNVELNVVDSSGHHYHLFQGIVKNVKVSAHQDMYHLEVEAISYSYLLDLKPKSRSFQNKNMTYQELFQNVTSDHKNARVIDNASNGATIKKLMMQYNETEWEFVQRLASHFNAGLICDVRFGSPKYYVGLPQSRTINIDNFNYSIQKNIKRFRELSRSGVQGLKESDFISYEVETDQILGVGSQVNFRGKSLYVASVIGRVDQGVFMNHCELTPQNGLKQRRIEHEKVVGSSFNGKIIDIKNDRVKVHLDIDKEQDVQTACYFPYSTIYSSEDGSGWYCMPGLGDSVRLYCPDTNEGHAYAISSVHEAVSATPPAARKPPSGSAGGGTDSFVSTSNGNNDGGASAVPAPVGPSSGGIMRDDPNIKSLRSPCGKEIQLTPEGIFIDIGSSQITLTEDEGIILTSAKDIAFNADKNIVIKAEEEIQIIGTDSVEIKAGDLASVKIEDDDVAIVGYEVRSN